MTLRDPERRDAATVILVRDREDGPWEIFFMRRHRDQAFMGGAFVFPGGHLDEGDCDPELQDHLQGHQSPPLAERIQEPDLPESRARGLYLAAIRETFEEAGIMLAVSRPGSVLDFRDGETQRRFASDRERVHRGELTLKEIAVREGILFDLERLIPYAHWMTPQSEPKRFDTRFFLARLPEGQTPAHDEAELTASAWMTAAGALAEHAAGRIVLPPPTLKTVAELSAFRKTEELFAAAAKREIRPMLPQVGRTEEGISIRLPFDPEYSIAEFKLPPRPGEPSRVLHRKGVWVLR